MRKKRKLYVVDPKGTFIPRGNPLLLASGNPKTPPESLKKILDKIKGKGSAGIGLKTCCAGSRHLRWKVRQLLSLRLIKTVALMKEPKPAKRSKPAKKSKPTTSAPNQRHRPTT
jgi:hypothetical protein